MKPQSLITVILGFTLAVLGVIGLLSGSILSIIPLIIGVALGYLGWRGSRSALIIFGHTCIVVGCCLITLGLYMLPYCKPDLLHVFTRPLFWGFISLFGGICANYHGFCQCIRGPK